MTEAPPLSDSPPRRRRWWLLVVVIGVVLVVAGVGATAGVVMRYQPVQGGSNWIAPGTGVERVPDPNEPETGNLESRFRYADGRDLFYGLTLTNTGSWAVMVEEIELENLATGPHFMILPVAARYKACCVWDDARMKDFRPFQLGPGDSEDITIRAVMGNCEYYLPGSGSGRSIHRARISFMGVDHWVEIQVFPFAVEIPSDYKCPRRSPYP